MARGGARPGAGRPAGKSANTSPPSTRARARAREAAGNQRPWPADKGWRSVGEPARRPTTDRQATRAIRHPISALRWSLRGGGAAHLQSGRRWSGLPEGTARSLLARHPDGEPARSRHSANLRDGGPPAARPQAPAVAVLIVRGSGAEYRHTWVKSPCTRRSSKGLSSYTATISSPRLSAPTRETAVCLQARRGRRERRRDCNPSRAIAARTNECRGARR